MADPPIPCQKLPTTRSTDEMIFQDPFDPCKASPVPPAQPESHPDFFLLIDQPTDTQLSLLMFPSIPQTDSADLGNIANKGLTFKSSFDQITLRYVGADRIHDTLHSATLTWSHEPLNQWATEQVVTAMRAVLPEDFFLTRPDWKLRLITGGYADYLQKKNSSAEENKSFAIDAGFLVGGNLDFSFAYFDSTLLIQSKFPMIQSSTVNKELRPEDLLTEIALTYHLFENQLRVGTRVYVNGGLTIQDLLFNNWIFTLEMDI
ncbi:MAG: hypothetical protein HYU97_00460 [Deltaproteobacteria bacterium]|nr:hypothetical protein [Deltaproteobacteria bacterium]